MKARADQYLSLCDGMFSEPRRWRQGAPASRSPSRNRPSDTEGLSRRALDAARPRIWITCTTMSINCCSMRAVQASGRRTSSPTGNSIYDDTVVRNDCVFPITSGTVVVARAAEVDDHKDLWGALTRLSPSNVEVTLVQRNRPPAGTPVQKHEGCARPPGLRVLFSYVFSDQLRSLDLAPKGAVRFQGFCTAQKADRSRVLSIGGGMAGPPALGQGSFFRQSQAQH